jgi:hypothetical protein
MADIATGGGRGKQRQSVGWTLHGVGELQAKLEAMGKGGKLASVLRSAVRAGATRVRAVAASRLISSPVGAAAVEHRRQSDQEYTPDYKGHWSYDKNRFLLPGYAQRHVIVKTYVSRDKNGATAAIGPTKEAFYASQFLEFGIPSRGYRASPWLASAFEENRVAATASVRKKIDARIRQLARQKPTGVKRK